MHAVGFKARQNIYGEIEYMLIGIIGGKRKTYKTTDWQDAQDAMQYFAANGKFNP